MCLYFRDTRSGNSCSLAYSCLPSRRYALSEAVKVRPQPCSERGACLRHFLLTLRFLCDCLLLILLRSSWNSSFGLSESWRRWLDFFRTCRWWLLKRICSSLVTWLNLRVSSNADQVKTFRSDLKLGRIAATLIIWGCRSSRAAMMLTSSGSHVLCLHFSMFYNYLINLCRNL